MTEKQVQQYKELYPKGTRLELLQMNDTYAPVLSGTRGTVEQVDDLGQIQMQWDNGRTLALIPQVDAFRTLTETEVHDEKWENAVRFGDDTRIILPDKPIDCSGLGDFDELEVECWDLVKYYCKYFGIELLSNAMGEEDISYDIAKAVQEVILNALKEAGVQFDYFGGNQEEGLEVVEKSPERAMEVM